MHVLLKFIVGRASKAESVPSGIGGVLWFNVIAQSGLFHVIFH